MPRSVVRLIGSTGQVDGCERRAARLPYAGARRHRRVGPVTDGESAASLFRSADGQRYAECVPAGHTASLEAERDRADRLGTQDVPGPRVLGWRVNAEGAALVTSAVA